MLKLLLLCSLYATVSSSGPEVFETEARTPTVVSTWSFIAAAEKAWKILHEKRGSALDAIEHGCAVCEYKQCDFTVGFGGSPDENGETTLDSMIMDGTTMKVGAVGCLRRIKNAIGVARKVLDTSYHTFLVGDLATKFAVEMGFKEESLATPYSTELHSNWTKNKCQPNFRRNVSPNPTENCGPYHPLSVKSISAKIATDLTSHDTIGMIAIDSKSRIASGTSTNGSKFKIAGRVGDSPVPGSGSYADGTVGAAAATGDGDVMMRFVPTFFAVEEMRKGKSPEEAAQAAIDRIAAKYPKFQGAIIALRKDGAFGAACHGMKSFPYVVANPEMGAPTLLHKECSNFLH